MRCGSTVSAPVRASRSGRPRPGGGPLHLSQVVGTATLDEGITRIPVAATAAPMSEVLVWITRLGPAGDRFRTSLSEAGFTAFDGP